MKAKVVAGAILVAWCWASAAIHAQSEAPSPEVQPPPIRKDGIDARPDLSAAPAVPTGLSDWILYRRPNCCSAGPSCPLFSELYLRVGPSFPVGGHYLDRELVVGYTLVGGARALFFDPDMTSAWVVDASVGNSNNGSASPGRPHTLDILLPNQFGIVTRNLVPVTIVNYNRTYVGLGGGKEWYLWEPANAPGCHWRVGVDGGGRYGTSSMSFNEIRHRTDTIYGVYAAFHTDVEAPCGCCVFTWGMRCEYAYTWCSILQKATNMSEINVLATMGVRY